MAASPAVTAGRSPPFDKWSFLEYMNDHGRAYRNQAMELISICRVFSRAAEKVFSQDEALSRALQVCDDALSAATKARKARTLSSNYRIQLAVRELHTYEETFHLLNQNVEKRMEEAMAKDEETKKVGLSRFTSLHSITKWTRTEDPSSRVVEFHLLTSITDTQPSVVRQVLTDGSNESEILWNFNRYPLVTGKRVTLAANPYFYDRDRLPITSPDKFQHRFTTGPMDDYREADKIYVLTNRPCRVFFEFGENSRAFDNVWRTPKGIFIFKSICGKLEGEHIVGAPIQGRTCWWRRHVEPLPSQHQVGSPVDLPNPPGTSAMIMSTTVTPAWVSVEDWRVAIFHVLDGTQHSQDIKIRITITRPVPG